MLRFFKFITDTSKSYEKGMCKLPQVLQNFSLSGTKKQVKIEEGGVRRAEQVGRIILQPGLRWRKQSKNTNSCCRFVTFVLELYTGWNAAKPAQLGRLLLIVRSSTHTILIASSLLKITKTPLFK